jgi:guanylate kinase
MESEITGHLILLMGPTGSGKGELVRHALSQFPEIHLAVSCTTRAPRPGEEDGIHYHFIDAATFQQKIDAGDFLEWAPFGGNRYGTLKSEVVDRLKRGEIILNEIELQGVEALRTLIPKEYRTVVYVEAGDWEALSARAMARAPISEAELSHRHERYQEEIQSKPYADFVVDNHDGQLPAAKATFTNIITQIITP